MSQPVMLYHARSMAKKTSALRPHHLKDLRYILRVIKRDPPSQFFNTPSSHNPYTLEVVSDASKSPIAEGGAHGGYFILRRRGGLIHSIIWSARKLRRVARSSSTEELLPASYATSTLVYLQELFAEISYRPKAAMLFDSHALHNLAT